MHISYHFATTKPSVNRVLLFWKLWTIWLFSDTSLSCHTQVMCNLLHYLSAIVNSSGVHHKHVVHDVLFARHETSQQFEAESRNRVWAVFALSYNILKPSWHFNLRYSSKSQFFVTFSGHAGIVLTGAGFVYMIRYLISFIRYCSLQVYFPKRDPLCSYKRSNSVIQAKWCA